MRVPPGLRPAPHAHASGSDDARRDHHGLPGHVVDDFAAEGAGEAHCPRCDGPARFVVRPMVYTLPGTGFSLIGRGGVCQECDTLVAMRRVSFDAIVAAWGSRPAGTQRVALLVQRSGESEGAFQRRVAAILAPLDQATAETLGAFAPPAALLRDVGISVAGTTPLPPFVWEPGASQLGIFGWLRGTRQ
ncbi:MAG: hypothetical protein ACYC3Q_10140 [Gemmatimonadaceae bacterium]